MTKHIAHYGLIAGAPSSADASALRRLDGYARGLTKNPTLANAPDTWAIGRAFLAEGEIACPYSWADIESDVAWGARMEDLIGAARGDFLFFSYLYSQSAQSWPWMKAGFDRGAKMATGMPTQWDAYRLEMYLRLFKVKLVFGVSTGVLDGLEGAGHDIGAQFRKAGRVLALPGAWERLNAADVDAWKVRWIGPILAVDPCDGEGAHFDHGTWSFVSDQGRLLLSNKRARMTPFVRADTGVHGAVETVGGEPRLFIES